MRANINLKRGTDRTGRIASRGFCLIAGEPIEIDQGRRFTLAYRLPPLVHSAARAPMLRGRPYRIGQSGNRVPAPGGGGRACEREAISERTKAALAAAKARGTRLGTPQPGRRSKTHGQGPQGADEAIRGQYPAAHSRGAGAIRAPMPIAGQLNARKVATARGGRWTHVQVGQILERAAK